MNNKTPDSKGAAEHTGIDLIDDGQGNQIAVTRRIKPAPATAEPIQRWEYYRDFSGDVVSEYGVRKSPIGQFVTYEDHIAALKAAYEKGYYKGYDDGQANA